MSNKLITVSGVVIGRRIIGENNCFLDILTNEFGIIETVVHAFRKPTGKNTSGAELFTYGTYCVSRRTTSSGVKYTLNSCEVKFSFFDLSKDLRRFSLAAYFAEVADFVVTREQPQNDIVRFFAITLFELARENSDIDLIKAVFELKLTALSGFMPDVTACSGCGCYEKNIMHFIYDSNALMCDDCAREAHLLSTQNHYLSLSPTLLYAIRYAIFSDISKVYKGRLFDVGNNQKDYRNFCAFAEKYITNQLERTFGTLGYYRNIAEFQL